MGWERELIWSLLRSIGRSKGGLLVLKLLPLVGALLPSLDCKMNGGRQLRRWLTKV